jgi:hypothetical protein
MWIHFRQEYNKDARFRSTQTQLELNVQGGDETVGRAVTLPEKSLISCTMDHVSVLTFFQQRNFDERNFTPER